MAEYSAKQLRLNKSSLPNSIVDVVASLSRAGFDAFIVGGGVRDALLGLHPKDFDAVTDAKPHEVKDVFGKRCRIIGRRFQLAHVYSGRDMIEVATFRAPPKDDSHTTEDGMLMRDNVWGDIEQDFARRDFSINALYYQPIKGVVYDFCHALEDINSKTLRLLGHAPIRIGEDPVRLLRALRFKAKLGFEFDTELSEQFHDNNWSLLEQVSPHRLYDESQKMFTGGYLVPLLPLLFEYGAIKHLIIYPPTAPSQLVQEVAINTDRRIAAGKSINPAFFYAAILWENYLFQLNKFKQKKLPFVEAQSQAAGKVIERQRIKTAIPKFAEQFIRDIWTLQPKLANPKVKQISQLAEHPRFRAAFDFLLLRETSDDEQNPLSESTNGMGAWWQDYQAMSEKQKQHAIDEFAKQARRGGRNRTRSDRSTKPSGDTQIDVVSVARPPKQDQDNRQPAQPANTAKQPSGKSSSISKQHRQELAQLQKLSLADSDHAEQHRVAQPLFTVETGYKIETGHKTVSQQSEPAAQLGGGNQGKSLSPSQTATDNDHQCQTMSSNQSEAKPKQPSQQHAHKGPQNRSHDVDAAHADVLVLDARSVPALRRRRQPSQTIAVCEREAAKRVAEAH